MAQPHLLAIPVPAQGHINPMLQLCRKLVSHGFFITFLVPMQKERFILPQQESESIHFEFIVDELLCCDPYICNDKLFPVASSQTREFLEMKIEEFLPEFIKRVSGTLPLTCLITDLSLVRLQTISLKLGVCKASLYTGSASTLCINYHLHLLQERGLLPVRGGGNTMIGFIPGLPRMAARDFPTMIQKDEPDDPGFELRMERMRMAKKDTWVFMNTFHELETSQLHSLDQNHLAIGPLLWSSDDSSSDKRYSVWEEDTSCLEWLDKQAAGSVVYVSFGSLAKLSLEELKEINTGLRQSGRPFLWVMRADLVENVENGQYSLEEDLCKFVSWAPQLLVLRHPSIGAFLTHCGWNSTLEAVFCGVPILARPMIFEQRLNCVLAVDHWKIGLRITHEVSIQNDTEVNDLTVTSAREVQAAVRHITGERGNELRENVKRLMLAATNASSTGTSYNNLKLFIDDMRQRASNCGN